MRVRFSFPIEISSRTFTRRFLESHAFFRTFREFNVFKFNCSSPSEKYLKDILVECSFFFLPAIQKLLAMLLSLRENQFRTRKIATRARARVKKSLIIKYTFTHVCILLRALLLLWLFLYGYLLTENFRTFHSLTQKRTSRKDRSISGLFGKECFSPRK